MSLWSELYMSGAYRSCWDYSHPSPELAGFLAGCPVSSAAVCLDVGCGSGRDAVFLAEQGFRAHGLDICQEALDLGRDLARQRKVDVAWHRGDALAPPLPTGMFDMITDRGCFHHVPDGDRPPYAAQMARLLRPGGYLFVRGAATRLLSFVPVTRDALETTIVAHGFSILSARPFQMVADTLSIEGVMALLRRDG